MCVAVNQTHRMKEAESLREHFSRRLRRLQLRYRSPDNAIPGISPLNTRFDNRSNGRAGPIGHDEQIRRDLLLHLFSVLSEAAVVDTDLVALILDARYVASRTVLHLAVTRSDVRQRVPFQIVTIHAVVVRSQQVVRQVPAGHILPVDFLVDHVALLVEVEPFVGRHSDGLPGPVVTVEELNRVASCHDSRALVVQQVLWCAFQQCGVVAMRLERCAGEESGERTADLEGC